MKIHTKKEILYDPYTLEPRCWLTVGYNLLDAKDAVEAGEDVNQLIVDEFKTLLTRPTPYNSDPESQTIGVE